MKKIATIGASYLQEPLVKKANEMGIYTICFAWADGAIWLLPDTRCFQSHFHDATMSRDDCY